MKTLTKLSFAFMSFLLIQACEPELAEIPDPDLTRQEDIEEINAFIEKYELGTPDTTENGARYYIYHEGDQSQEKVKLNDIVTFDYTGFYMDDSSVFMTSVPFVADTASLDTLDAVTYTFSETGWSLRYVFVTAQYLSTGGTALSEAISTGFPEMVPGDRIVVFLPSDQALNSANSIQQKVVFYDIELTGIED
jgi:hypothetical protein